MLSLRNPIGVEAISIWSMKNNLIGYHYYEISQFAQLKQINKKICVPMSKTYYVYMMTNKTNTTIYTGVTNNLIRRVMEHKSDRIEGFTKRYRLHKLVYFEETNDVNTAIAREKQIKGGSRQKKIDLIEKLNPNWEDLYDTFWTN